MAGAVQLLSEQVQKFHPFRVCRPTTMHSLLCWPLLGRFIRTALESNVRASSSAVCG